jgi:hypothetical protein
LHVMLVFMIQAGAISPVVADEPWLFSLPTKNLRSEQSVKEFAA